MAEMLIADDELILRDILSKIFYSVGHEVPPGVNG